MKKLSVKTITGLALTTGLVATGAYVVANNNNAGETFANEANSKETLNYVEKTVEEAEAELKEAENQLETANEEVAKAEDKVTAAAEKVKAAENKAASAKDEETKATAKVDKAVEAQKAAEKELASAKTEEAKKAAQAKIDKAKEEVKQATKAQEAAHNKVEEANKAAQKAAEDKKAAEAAKKAADDAAQKAAVEKAKAEAEAARLREEADKKTAEETVVVTEEKAPEVKQTTQSTKQTSQSSSSTTPKKETQNNNAGEGYKRELSSSDWDKINAALQAEAERKAKEAEEQAKKDAEAKAQKEAEEQAKREAEEKAKQEREAFEKFIEEQNEAVKHWGEDQEPIPEHSDTFNFKSVPSNAAEEAYIQSLNRTITYVSDELIKENTLNVNRYGTLKTGQIWFVEVSCDLSMGEGFTGHFNSAKVSVRLDGARDSVDKLVFTAPAAKAGYHFAGWREYNVTYKTETGDITFKGYEAVYKAD